MIAEKPVVASMSIPELIVRADSLGLFPALATRIRDVANDAQSSIVELEAAVGLDSTLSAALLRLANSSYYGMRRQIGTVRQAIWVLGFRATRDLALGLALASVGRRNDPLRGGIWNQAVRGALATRGLAELLDGADRREVAGEAFVAGLLRDLGRVLLLELERARYAPLSRDFLAASCGSELAQAERRAFGFDHAELGAACLDHWRLPDATCEAVRHHHTPPEASGLRAVVWLADRMERLEGLGADTATLLQAGAPVASLLELGDSWLPAVREALAEAKTLAQG